jgi:23S rRNA (cytosine1962-C5)-methyltransferase
MYPHLSLKPDKLASSAYRHPWVFSGAIASKPDGIHHGDIVQIVDGHDKVLGTGTFSNRGSIAVRIFEFGEAVINQKWFETKIREAFLRRTQMGYGPNTETTGYRIVFGESDSIPGLVVDRYEGCIVFQLATAGIDKLREPIIEALKAIFHPTLLVERSDLPTRKEEGLEEFTAIHHSESQGPIEFREHGLTFLADPVNGQKTGFFLDQKQLRLAIRKHADKATVLNLFSNSGSFSVAALAGGASEILQVDSSQLALDGTQAHLEKNNLDITKVTSECSDVFQWLGKNTQRTFDMVICDPPALIKTQRDIEAGRKAYHFLNRAALRLVNHGGIFITSSCSNHLSDDDFAFTLRRAASQSGVILHVLDSVHQSPDHPSSIYFPESVYLKSLVLAVSYHR